MTTNEIKHNVRCYVHGYNSMKNNSITGKVEIRVRWDGGREVLFYSGYYAESHKWDVANQIAFRNTQHKQRKGVDVSASVINKKISDMETAINEAFTSFALDGMHGEDILPQILKEEVYKRLGLSTKEILIRKKKAGENVKEIIEQQRTLFEWIDEFKNEGKLGGWRKDTVKKFMTLNKRLQQFDNKLSFSMLDEDKMKEFASFLINKRGYHNVSVQCALHNFRWFLRWAEKKNLITDKNVINYKSNLRDVEDKEVIYLTWDEFQQLYAFNVPESKQYLQRVKDVFIFQCTTGLRYADLAGLKRSDIQNGKIVVVTSKTALKTDIDFNKYSREVYNKYENETYEDNKALPVPSNQKYNKYLQELCKLAGINNTVTIAYKSGSEIVKKECEKWERVTTHSARRTFVSVGLSLGATPEEIARITGHHSLQIMQKHYIGTDEKQRKHATNVWDEKTERDAINERLASFSVAGTQRNAFFV
jgi:integrase